MSITRTITLFVLIFILYVIEGKAQTHTIYGYISDASNGESLIGCNIYNIRNSKGVTSNNYGYYSLQLDEGKQTIVFSYIGYQNDTLKLKLDSNFRIDISLSPTKTDIKGINIITTAANNNYTISSNSIDVKKIGKIPNVMGEADILKYFQLLPGVLAITEGGTSISVRGGSRMENLYFLDEAPIYNPSHSLSLVSTFNNDALKKATLYKGYYPVQFGGGLSSVIDLRMKEGNIKETSLSGNVGVVASRLNLEIPIIKNKTSVAMSGRYGYPGSVLNSISRINKNPHINIKKLSSVPEDNIVWFYDASIKIRHTINKKNLIFISAYSSKDEFELKPLKETRNLKWGNNIITFRWNHFINTKLFVNQSVIFSKYSYSQHRINDYYYSLTWKSNMDELDYKIDFDYYRNNKNHIKFGGILSSHRYKPGEISYSNDYGSGSFVLNSQNTINADVYISDEYKASNKINIEYGLRFSSQTNIGKGIVYNYDENMETVIDTSYYSFLEPINTYAGLEPRFALKYQLNKIHKLMISYSRTKQYRHLMSNSSLGLPTDVWLPSNKYIKPSTANQISLAYYANYRESRIKTSAEIYYRNMDNIIDFVDNANLFLNEQIETQILPGKRKAYGLELMFNTNYEHLNSSISYTLSKVEQYVEGVNDNKWYPTTYDKRHTLSIYLSYKFLKVLEVNTVFKFASGGFTTVPVEFYYFEGRPFVKYSARNSYKLPNYHRLDISLSYNSMKNLKRNWKSIWSIGVYNVYNRKNVFTIDVSMSHNYHVLDEMSINKIYLYGVVPYISYKFKFR